MPPKKQAPLPAKEAALFKTLLSQYESRQLKKAIKTSDQILKKVGDHGETISMKGLVLTYQGKRDEGMELVKKGVRLDLSSHICWHVYGLVHKQDKNYEEALKCYTQALKFDPANMTILRDAATLQTQLRLFDSLAQTRLTVLKLKPSIRQNWVSLAIAYALNNNWQACQKLMEEFLSMIKEVPAHDPERSELLLFYIAVLERNEAYGEALSKLTKFTDSNEIVDKARSMAITPRLMRKLGRIDDAGEHYKHLIARNPECYDFYQLYFENQGLSLSNALTDDAEKIVPLIENLASEFAHALAPQRILLTVTSGEKFEALAKRYIHRGLKRNIPSLFADLKPLYKDELKRGVIHSIVEAYRANLESDENAKSEDDNSPAALVWTLYFLAQHHSALGQYQEAEDILRTAIGHTPTLPELYMARARNLKRAGDYLGAVSAMDSAQELDGQDRFLNTKCATYHLRAGEVEEAQRLFGLFTKKDALSPAKDLEDMQSFKFLGEDAEARLRNDQLALALKRFRAINKIFCELHDDQFDFHAYCIRRFTLNIYLDVLKWDDDLQWHPLNIKAVIGATKIYVRLFDEPGLAAAQTAPPPPVEGEKKSKKQAKKEKIKAAEEARKAAAAEKNDEDVAPVAKDDDPDGHKAISVEDPLEQAVKLLQPFLDQDHKNTELWLAIYDVAIRRKKYLQALWALCSAKKLEPTNPSLHYRIIDIQLVASSLEQSESIEHTVLKEGITKLAPGERTLAVQNSQFLQENSSSAVAVLSVARTSKRLGATTAEIEETVQMLLQENVPLSPKVALEALSFLEEIQSEKVSEFRQGCRQKLPLATIILSKEELVALKKERDASKPTEDGSEEQKAIGDALVVEPLVES